MDTMYIVFGILFLALVLFVWGKIRYDLVAIICLLLLVFTSVLTAEEAFLGFSHPAVITVGMILVVSHGLVRSGLIEKLAKILIEQNLSFIKQLLILCLFVCIASAFMNNVGALAMTMPLAIFLAEKQGKSPSSYLMPIAFASLLGGMTTLIGTPPNIIISTIRAEQFGEPFKMFDFAPVGVGVAALGILFIVAVGWRLVPKRVSKEEGKNKFNVNDYTAEVLISEDSELKDQPHNHIYKLTDGNVQILNIIRNKQFTNAPGRYFVFRVGDIISLQGDPDDIKDFLKDTKTNLVGEDLNQDEKVDAQSVQLVEAVVMQNSPILRRSAADILMSFRYGVNLLAISRQNQQIQKRLDHVKFQVGDVLLLQGEDDKIDEAIESMGCLPLADRGLNFGEPKNIVMSLGIFLLAIGLIIFGVVEVQVGFTLAALLMILFKLIPLREIYTSIDWPVLILLSALLPLGFALEKSGGAQFLAEKILLLQGKVPVWVILTLVLAVTMFLSDIINNAATVVLMAPIAINIASGLDVSVEPFLMAVAIGGSCAFLTPIGHQSNALVMGPGGYKFGDYLRLGAPLEVLILVVSIPLILLFWPL